MTLKVIQIGNSAGIILPHMLRSEEDIEVGDELEIQKGKKGYLLTKVKKTKKPVSDKFAQMVDEFMTAHEDVLQELAKK